jgi:hypothetical protein
MKYAIGLLTTFCCAFFLSGCYYDKVEGPNENLPHNVSFKNDVQPIFNANCAPSGCHDDKPTHDPQLVEGFSYNALIEGHFVNTAVPKSSIIYGEIESGGMPPSGSLSLTDVKIVLAWITEGAQNN